MSSRRSFTSSIPAGEEACQERGIRLCIRTIRILPPRPPKLNGHVERAQRTHTEEFSHGDPSGYDLYDGELEVAHLNWALQEWEWTYNDFRPHQALDGKTPMEYICVRILRDAQHPKEENATQSWPLLPICLICSEQVQGVAWG